MEKSELLQPAFIMSVGDLIDGVDSEREGAAALLERQWTEFMTYLEKHKVNARLRRSRGKDIDAACGQLANKSN